MGVDDPADASHSQLYGYDSLDRLTSADIGAWNGPVAFTYDAAGNRTSIIVASPALLPFLPGNLVVRGGIVKATKVTTK